MKVTLTRGDEGAHHNSQKGNKGSVIVTLG